MAFLHDIVVHCVVISLYAFVAFFIIVAVLVLELTSICAFCVCFQGVTNNASAVATIHSVSGNFVCADCSALSM